MNFKSAISKLKSAVSKLKSAVSDFISAVSKRSQQSVIFQIFSESSQQSAKRSLQSVVSKLKSAFFMIVHSGSNMKK